MKNIILKTYSTLLDITMILVVIGATIAGASSNGAFGAVLGFVGGFIFVTIFFGVIILFVDMRESLQAIKKAIEEK